ncbi:MAG: NAD(P)/FAD-dependent oxidoreductase [Candidatus Lokiarchaeota archaeon]|nr:NAD(P)/FAD-dependent oxidoreductase [Candidatus Lokiarchaeota archaeon]
MDSSNEYADVCIIGASIAGNYLAYLLSNSNLKIVVIEEHDEVGLPFQCAGIISKKLSTLIDLPQETILNRVKFARLVAPSGNSVRLSGDEEPYIVDRVALDKLFYEKIKNVQNVKYFFGERFKTFERVQKSVRGVNLKIKTSKRVIESKILIGCDGPLSTVGKQLGITNDIIYGTQVRINARFDMDEAQLLFYPQIKNLFAWIVPEGKNIFRIGLAASKNPLKILKRILNNFNLDIKNAISRQGGIIPIGAMNKIAFKNILLLGDSACHVKATTGGGVVMLLICAKFAANCIINSFLNNNFSKYFAIKHYQKPCLKAIGRQLKLHFIIRTILNYFSYRDYENFFTILNTNNVVNSISLYGDMDFPKKVIFKLIKDRNVLKFLLGFVRRHPNLLLKILKILIK